MITIVGEGVWGTALSTLFKQNKKEFIFWDKKSKIDGSTIVLLALPTQAIREVLEANKENLTQAVVVNASKGIELKTFKLPFQITKEVLGEKVKYFSLIGPSFASGLEKKTPTMVNLGCSPTDQALNKEIESFFQTDYFRVKISTSVEALELSGALKNVYAIACGIAEGLNFSANTKANLISLAYMEINKLCQKLNYKIDEDALESVLGDLILTCSSAESRNFKFGKLLTKVLVSQALQEINSTVEGHESAFAIPEFSQRNNLELPLASYIYETIKLDKPSEVSSRFAAFVKTL
jgi:glycerol-3-phosphate dehydrogenase (NAD(P)+)